MRDVCVIGCGASGLSAIKHLKDILNVSAYEAHSSLGGVWNDSKPDSPLYDSLRTNLPKEIMGFFDFEFSSDSCVQKDFKFSESNSEGFKHHLCSFDSTEKVSEKLDRSFVSAESVCKYLVDYSERFGLSEFIEFGCLVTDVEFNKRTSRWSVTCARKATGDIQTKYFDFVIVCNGHFNQRRYPSFVQFPSHWLGKVLHSKDYVSNESFFEHDENKWLSFQDKSVTIVGYKASGMDITDKLSQVAKEIHVCLSSSPDWTFKDFEKSSLDVSNRCKIFLHGRMLELLSNSKKVRTCHAFEDGKVEVYETDVVLFCTGYEYSYEFFKKGPLKSLVKNSILVSDLYRQIQHRSFPSLFFVGLQFGVIPFPLFDIQMIWIKQRIEQVVKHQAIFPMKEEDYFSADAFKEYFKFSHSFRGKNQFEFWKVLLADAGVENMYYVENRKYREAVYRSVSKQRISIPGEAPKYRLISVPSFTVFKSSL